MKDSTDTWQIVHIPDKPPIPPNQQPTVNVFASVIETKLANSLIRRLNQIAPLESLRHVKRIQKKAVDGGKTQLSVILCLASENDDDQSSSLAQDVQELIDSYQLRPFIAKACKYAATTKEEWEEQLKLWPTSYHPPTCNIDGITGFTDVESQSVFRFMRVAIDLAKSGDYEMVNAAVIVDPSMQQIISSGCDQVCSWHAPTSKIIGGSSWIKQPAAFSSHHDSNGLARHINELQTGSADKHERLYAGVSCLNPWKFPETRLDAVNSCYWHPLRHAAMLAIESSAERDRLLFPVLGQSEEKTSEAETLWANCPCSPAKKQKMDLANVENGNESSEQPQDSHHISARPYLCTGYDIYLVWEPCAMCAMALVHQRIRRIFYALPNPSAGALGSVYRLQGEKSLNHHYAVFRVILPKEVLNMVETAVSSTTANDQSAAAVG